MDDFTDTELRALFLCAEEGYKHLGLSPALEKAARKAIPRLQALYQTRKAA